MAKNLLVEYKIDKKDSTFRGNAILLVGRAGIACTVASHEYDNLTEATAALNKALPIMLRIAAEDYMYSIEGRIPERTELEILEIFIDAIERTEKMAAADGIVSLINNKN